MTPPASRARRTTAPAVAAVLFDFDGVIAATPAENCRAWQRAFRPFSVPVDPQEFYLMEGSGALEVSRRFGASHGLSDEQLAGVFAEKQRLYFERGRFRLYPKTLERLRALRRRGPKLALVSGATRDRLERTAPQALLRLFDACVTAESVARTKPHPDPFLHAMRLLAVPAAACVVVENAPFGIAAAKAAGAYCLALTTTLPARLLRSADEVHSSHAGLFRRLDRITAPRT